MSPGSEEHHIPVRQLYEEMFSRGRYELTEEVFARGCAVHFGNRHIRLEDAVAEGKGWRSAAPNLTMTVDEISTERDIVSVTWTAKGTHSGHGQGLRPSGKLFLLRGRSRFRVMDGKIHEAWNEEYRPELLRQLGVSKGHAFIMLMMMNFLSAIRMMIASLTA